MTINDVRGSTHSIGPAPGSSVGDRRHRRSFWAMAVGFAVLMAFTTIPTTLYPLYQRVDGFGTYMITVIFAAYGFGVMGGLYFVGHLSDHFGRRRVLFAAIGVELVSAVIFIVSHDVAALLAARFLCGFGIGAVTSTATAALLELRSIGAPSEPPRLASTVASAVNLGGLALGPLIGGIFTQWLPVPLRLIYVVFGVLLVAVGLMVVSIPETATPQTSRYGYRPQRIQVAPEHRGEFAAAGIAAASAFAVLGFFTALTGVFIGSTLDIHQSALVGVTVFASMGSSAVSQVALARLTVGQKVSWGLGLMITGLATIATAGALTSLWLFIAAALIAGSGVGLLFSAAISVAGRIAEPQHRGETIAGMFLAAYVGITIPVIGCGIALIWWSTPTVMIVFAVAVAVTVAAAGAVVLRQTSEE